MNKRIMIIDDDREFAQEFNDLLHSNGYDVSVVGDPTLAVDLIRKVKPDLILLDLKMHKKSGFEIACQLRYDPQTARIPVITISGFYSSEEDTFFMHFCAFKKWLKKPVDPAKVIEEIEEVLNMPPQGIDTVFDKTGQEK